MTILFKLLMTIYFIVLVRQMYMGDQDIINYSIITNNFKGENNVINLNEYNFMPYIIFDRQTYNIEASIFNVSTVDEDKDKVIDYQEVKKYVNIYLNFRQRGVDEQGQTYDRVVAVPFRNCRMQDFLRNNFEPDLAFYSDIKRAFCPDIEAGADLYQLIGKYSN